MTKIENTLDAGPDGANVTRSNIGDTGDQPDYLFINNQVVNGGNSSVQYTDDLDSSGVPMCMRIASGSGLTYLRWDPAGLSGDRFVMRRGFYLENSYSGYSAHTVLSLRLAGNPASAISLDLNNVRPRPTAGANWAAGSSYGPTLPLGEVLWAELAVSPASSSGAEDGVIEYRITDDDHVVIASDNLTGIDLLAQTPEMLLFGGGRESGFLDYMWEIQFGALESGWWGPLGTTEPLETPELTLVDDTPASSISANDREITVSWPAVPNATSYRALTATHGDTNYTTVDEDVSSPYTFEGVTGAPVRVAIQATTD